MSSRLLLPRARRLALLQGGLALTGLLLNTPLCAAGTPARVVFLNPGEPEERGAGPFWRMVSRYMEAAARALGMELEVQYAFRDRMLMLSQAEKLAQQRREPPDYVLLVNEKSQAPELLRALALLPSKIVFMHNKPTAGQRRELGNERQGRHPNWIGTVVTDNARGGYRLMQELYRQLDPATEPRILGITGEQATSVSMERAAGVQAFVHEAGRGRILQLAHSNWTYEDGEQKARVLLARHPTANILWAGNDSMAIGALRAVQARGAKVLVGGMGGWPDALQSINEGGMAATVEGHYLIGALALLLLHDFHHGWDFAAHGGAIQELDYLRVVSRSTPGPRRTGLLDENALDFRGASRALNPRSGPPSLSIEGLVQGARGKPS